MLLFSKKRVYCVVPEPGTGKIAGRGKSNKYCLITVIPEEERRERSALNPPAETAPRLPLAQTMPN